MKCLSIVTYLKSSLRALLAVCVLSSAAPAFSMFYWESPQIGKVQESDMINAIYIMGCQMGGTLNFTRFAAMPMTFADSPRQHLRKCLQRLSLGIACGSLSPAVQACLSNWKQIKLDGIKEKARMSEPAQESVVQLQWQAPSEEEVWERQVELENWFLENNPGLKYRATSRQ